MISKKKSKVKAKVKAKAAPMKEFSQLNKRTHTMINGGYVRDLCCIAQWAKQYGHNIIFLACNDEDNEWTVRITTEIAGATKLVDVLLHVVVFVEEQDRVVIQ